MHESVLKDVFSDDRGTFGLRGKRHKLGLHVGRKTGVLFRRYVGGPQIPARANAHRFLTHVQSNTALAELGQHRTQVRRVTGVDVEIAAGDCTCDKESSRFYSVGVDAMTSSMESRYTRHANG